MSAVAAPARVERWTPVSASFTAGLAAPLALLAFAPLVLGENSLDNLIQLYFLVILAIMWNALAGYGGLVSVGQQAFIGIGAYAVVFLSVQHSVNPYLAMLLATLIGGAISIPLAAVMLWLRGGAFAIGMWVVAEVFAILAWQLSIPPLGPDSIFGVNWSAKMIFMVLVGGLGTFEGPILGAVVLYLLQTYVSTAGVWYFVMLGGIAIGVALLLPRGLWGTVQERFNLQLLPVGYRLRTGGRT